MLNQVVPEGKTTAWNGISFTTPSSWYPVVVLGDYLLFEEGYAPVFEIKWQHCRGSFSAVSVLKRLGRMLPDTSAAPWTPPDEWINVLQDFEIFGFTWRNNRGKGNGLLLYHGPGQQVILLRFHSGITTDPSRHLPLLADLRFDGGNSRRVWRLFDIQAGLPGEAKLQSHEFLTGKYSLVFTLDGLRFSLLRFKPAAELLRDIDLLTFGRNLAGKGRPAAPSTPLLQRWSYRSTGIDRLRDILRRNPTCMDMQLQHFPEHNTILGVRVQGNSRHTGPLLDEITQRYKPV